MKTQRQIYDELRYAMWHWLTRKADGDPKFFTEDKINRIATKYAVEATIDKWREQYEKISNNTRD